MTWRGLQDQVQKDTTLCNFFQIKKKKHQSGKLHVKIVTERPSEAVGVDLIGPYTLKYKNGIKFHVIVGL